MTTMQKIISVALTKRFFGSRIGFFAARFSGSFSRTAICSFLSNLTRTRIQISFRLADALVRFLPDRSARA
jgi:hypothetical protein